MVSPIGCVGQMPVSKRFGLRAREISLSAQIHSSHGLMDLPPNASDIAHKQRGFDPSWGEK